MFWGLIMEPERRYTQKVKKAFHISMAAMDISTSGNEPSQIMCGYDGRNYLLCTLQKPDRIQCALDLEFAEGTEVSFATNGKSHIHLTGYLTDMDSDGLNLEDLAEEQEEEEEVLEEKKFSKKKLKKLLEDEPPIKKVKVNGIKKEEEDSDEEDDSDEAEEEAEDEEDSNDENAEEEDGSEEEDSDENDDEEVEEEEEQPKVVKSKKQKQQEAAKNKQQQPMVNGEKKKDQKTVGQQKGQKRKLDHGVVVEDLKVGEGPEAKPNKMVTVYYEGRLEKNNKMFDQSTKGPGFKFRLGKQEVIKGWDIGVAGMKVGGKRKIVCPPIAAYGARGSPPVIPPNSTLVFTVELKKVN